VTRAKPSRVPSKQLVRSAVAGGTIGGLVEIAAAMFGFPLPPGSGEVITAGATALAHYLQKHGRKATPETPP
jgi:hypothetical protein